MQELRNLIEDPEVAYEEETIMLEPDEISEAEIKDDGVTLAVGAIVYNNNEIILVKHEGGPHKTGWNVPGGSVQADESLEEAVEREIHEEVGIGVNIEEPRKVIKQTLVSGDVKFSMYFIMFSAYALTTDIKEKLGVEGESLDQARWFNTIPEESQNRKELKEFLTHLEESN